MNSVLSMHNCKTTFAPACTSVPSDVLGLTWRHKLERKMDFGMRKGVRLREWHTHSPDTGQEPPSGEVEQGKQATDRDAETDFRDMIACGFSGYRRRGVL